LLSPPAVIRKNDRHVCDLPEPVNKERLPLAVARREAPVRYWEIIADNLSCLALAMLVLAVPASGQTTNEELPSWSYAEQQDAMGRGTIHSAQAESLNTVSFGFPYEGVQHATLRLQQGGGMPSCVVLKVERGQFVSNSPIHARFDGAEVQRFDDVAQTTDGKSDRVGIIGEDYRRFIRQLGRAKKVQIEATFFHEDTRVFEFDVSQLRKDW